MRCESERLCKGCTVNSSLRYLMYMSALSSQPDVQDIITGFVAVAEAWNGPER